jgi:hypothetical protein
MNRHLEGMSWTKLAYAVITRSCSQSKIASPSNPGAMGRALS